jgi:hypothetical protein
LTALIEERLVEGGNGTIHISDAAMNEIKSAIGRQDKSLLILQTVAQNYHKFFESLTFEDSKEGYGIIYYLHDLTSVEYDSSGPDYRTSFFGRSDTVELKDSQDSGKTDSKKDTKPSSSTEDSSAKKPKKSMAEAASTLQEKYAEVEKFIRETYSTLILSKELTEEEIQALLKILVRVDKDISVFPNTRTPSRLYDWATVNSNITFPFISLKEAAKGLKFDKNFDYRSQWGYVDGKFIFPVKESLDADETFWGRIADLCTALGVKSEFSAMNDETVPDLSHTSLAKNNYFGYVFIRLVELSKSPSSATIRTPERPTILDSVKNNVDYVFLMEIYARDREKYENMQFSPVVHSCQRTIQNVKEVQGKKGKSETVTTRSYTGNLLSERLCAYVQKRITKAPESEIFSRFILSIIQKIALKVPENFVIPKVFFSTPGSLIRRQLRHGPEVTRKGKTVQGNTYIPFSFAKSSECEAMPETHRKSLTSIGASVSKHIDALNSLSVTEQNSIMPMALKYVNYCYSLSDELRKRWQKQAEVLVDMIHF